MKPAAIKYTALAVYVIFFLVVLAWGIALQWAQGHTGVWNYG